MILKRLLLALALVAGAAILGALLIAPASAAEGLDKGSSIVSFQLSHGDADFAGPESGGYISAYEHSEWGGGCSIQDSNN